jgi:hypothetical protein
MLIFTTGSNNVLYSEEWFSFYTSQWLCAETKVHIVFEVRDYIDFLLVQ